MSADARQRLEEPVTWKALLILLASFGAFMLTAMAQGISKSEAIVKAGTESNAQTVKYLAAKVDQHKLDSDAGQAEMRKDVQAVYQYLLTRQRQPRLEKE